MDVGEIIAIVISGFVTIITGTFMFIFKGYLSDLKQYRTNRETKERAKDDLVLGIARAMLLENYRECEAKGAYTMADREVYGKLFEAYRASGGDGVIDQLAPKIRSFPTTASGKT